MVLQSTSHFVFISRYDSVLIESFCYVLKLRICLVSSLFSFFGFKTEIVTDFTEIIFEFDEEEINVPIT